MTVVAEMKNFNDQDVYRDQGRILWVDLTRRAASINPVKNLNHEYLPKKFFSNLHDINNQLRNWQRQGFILSVKNRRM
jgi:hypothetical protein